MNSKKATYSEKDIIEYMQNRLIKQQKWHSNKSMKLKKKYNCFKTIEIILGVSIPIVALTTHIIKYKDIILAIIGSLMTFINYYLEHKKYHELWIDYRKLSEGLKREEYFFKAKVGIYDCEENIAFKHLVENVENMLSVQNDLWRTVVSKECNIDK